MATNQEARVDMVEDAAEAETPSSPAADAVRIVSNLPAALRDTAEGHELAHSGGHPGNLEQIQWSDEDDDEDIDLDELEEDMAELEEALDQNDWDGEVHMLEGDEGIVFDGKLT